MRRARRQKDWRVGDGNAGLASDFVDLADKMLKKNGKSKMGFILPIASLVSPHWKKVRNMWATEYHDVVVITIADTKGESCAFSADTTIAECMVVATKGKKTDNTGKGTFISLKPPPPKVLEAFEIANSVHGLVTRDDWKTNRAAAIPQSRRRFSWTCTQLPFTDRQSMGCGSDKGDGTHPICISLSKR